jgi:endo-1,4-beta-xylanase
MAADPGTANQALSSAILVKHASSITAESVMKANPIGVSEGVYDYSQADALVTYCQTNGIALRGHNLVWHATAPAWFFAGNTADPAYKATVRARLEKYITDVVTHFKGKVYCWDVVNECTSDDSSSNYRTASPWYTALGPDYIEYALRAARAADPTVQLFINDYSTEDPSKRARLMAIVADLQTKGVPLDGIGHQLHVSITSTTAAAVDQALADVEAKGLINHVTELDVSIYNDPGSCYASGSGCAVQINTGTAAYVTALQSQALLYRALYNAFAKRASVKSVTTWGIADNHTWLNSFPVTRTNYPLLFDTSGNPKSAFWAVVDPNFVP